MKRKTSSTSPRSFNQKARDLSKAPRQHDQPSRPRRSGYAENEEVPPQGRARK